MGFKQYIKRGIVYLLYGVPERKVYANISYLAPNEMLRGRAALVTGGTSGIVCAADPAGKLTEMVEALVKARKDFYNK